MVLEGDAGAASQGVGEEEARDQRRPLTLHGRALDVPAARNQRIHSDGEDAASLVKHADAAMYLAKERGKNNVQFYTAELDEVAARQFAMESELRLAIARGELLLHYQPKIDIASGAMRSVEALVRWAHPQRGLVPPGDFLPLARNGVDRALGRWVMKAHAANARLASAGLAAPSVAGIVGRQVASDTLVETWWRRDLTGIAASESRWSSPRSVMRTERASRCGADHARACAPIDDSARTIRRVLPKRVPRRN